jgi:predicted dehydrogenase
MNKKIISVNPGDLGVRKIGVAVIGAGIMGSAHAGAVVADARARLVGVASVPIDGARTLAAKHGAPVATDDYRELLKRSDVDLVVIATPDHLHTEIAIATAQAGKSLLVEKPLATSLRDADQIIDAVERSGVTAMTNFNHRWIPSYARAHEEIAAGVIGVPRMAYARKNDRIYVSTTMLSWAGKSSPAWFLSSHDIDLVCWYFGDDTATEVFATGVRGVLEKRGIGTEDAIQAQVRFASGAVATFESCWIYPNTFPSSVDSFIEVVGTEGVIHLKRTCEQLEIASQRGFDYPRTAIMPVLHGVQHGALPACLSYVIGCVASGAKPVVTLRSSRHVTAILDALHRSLASGSVVKVSS